MKPMGAAMRRVIAVALVGSIALRAGFIYVNLLWQGDRMLASIVVFAVCGGVSALPITRFAKEDAKADAGRFVNKLKSDGRYFFRVFAISGLLCMGASFRIDALGDEIWLFQLGMWIEAVSAWIRGYISLVGFWYTPRGYRGV